MPMAGVQLNQGLLNEEVEPQVPKLGKEYHIDHYIHPIQ